MNLRSRATRGRNRFVSAVLAIVFLFAVQGCGGPTWRGGVQESGPAVLAKEKLACVKFEQGLPVPFPLTDAQLRANYDAAVTGFLELPTGTSPLIQRVRTYFWQRIESLELDLERHQLTPDETLSEAFDKAYSACKSAGFIDW